MQVKRSTPNGLLTFEVGTIAFDSDAPYCYLFSYKGEDKVVYLPEKVNGVTVTWIRFQSFKQCPQLEVVHLPNRSGRFMIDKQAFIDCLRLRSLVPYDLAITYHPNAFERCPMMPFEDDPMLIHLGEVLTLTHQEAMVRLDFYIHLALKTGNERALRQLLPLVCEQERSFVHHGLCNAYHIVHRTQALLSDAQHSDHPALAQLVTDWHAGLFTASFLSKAQADLALRVDGSRPVFPQEIADCFAGLRFIITEINPEHRTMTMISETCVSGAVEFTSFCESSLNLTEEENEALLSADSPTVDEITRWFPSYNEKRCSFVPGSFSNECIAYHSVLSSTMGDYDPEGEDVIGSDYWLNGAPSFNGRDRAYLIDHNGSVCNVQAYEYWRDGHGYSGGHLRAVVQLDLNAPLFQGYLDQYTPVGFGFDPTDNSDDEEYDEDE